MSLVMFNFFTVFLNSSGHIHRWCAIFKTRGSINLQKPHGKARTARTSQLLQAVKKDLKGKTQISVRKLARKRKTSKSTIHRILRSDLSLFPFKKRKAPRLTDLQKRKKVLFAMWVIRTLPARQRKRIVFSDENIFDIDGTPKTIVCGRSAVTLPTTKRDFTTEPSFRAM